MEPEIAGDPPAGKDRSGNAANAQAAIGKETVDGAAQGGRYRGGAQRPGVARSSLPTLHALSRRVSGVGTRHGSVWRARAPGHPVSDLSSNRDAEGPLKMAPRSTLAEQL